MRVCRKFNELFSGTVAFQCNQAASCKCSKYKWKPVCEDCDQWVRAEFPKLTEKRARIPERGGAGRGKGRSCPAAAGAKCS